MTAKELRKICEENGISEKKLTEQFNRMVAASVEAVEVRLVDEPSQVFKVNPVEQYVTQEEIVKKVAEADFQKELYKILMSNEGDIVFTVNYLFDLGKFEITSFIKNMNEVRDVIYLFCGMDGNCKVKKQRLSA